MYNTVYMVKDLIALARPKHYLKNALIFLPLLFSGKIFHDGHFVQVLLAALAFSAAASIVYIINDIRDVEKDRQHPKKKFRPIASGTVSVNQAYALAVIFAAAVVILGYFANSNATAWLLLVIYVVINLAYSAGLKNVPIVDITILAAGFLLRVVYGGNAVDIGVSDWLYLTTLAGAFYLGLGKRRGELLANGAKSRKVNEFYTHDFLDKNMYVCMALTLVFYSLWATDPTSRAYSLFWTIPLIIILFMTYSLDIEKKGSLGDPVDVLLGNKTLAALTLFYVGLTAFLLYI
jgi:decaprenyl-phosphate phosphoribosyltransferase